MIDRRFAEPVAELTTSRVRGGRRGRLATLGLAAALISIVYIGVTGKSADSPKPSSASTAVPAAAAGPASTSAALASSNPQTTTVAQQYPGATQIVGKGPIGDPRNGLALNLTVGDTSTSAALTEIALRTYHASYSLPLPVPVTSVTLALVGTSQPSSYGTWQVPIETLRHGQIGDADVGSFATTSLLAAKGAFDPSANGTSPRSGKRAFRIEVTGAQLPNEDILNVTVQVGRDPVWPNDQYQVTARVGAQELQPTWQTAAPGLLIGEFDVYGPIHAQTIVLQLRALPGADPLLGFAPVASYAMTVPRRNAASGAFSEAAVSQPPADSPTLLGITRNGFEWRSSFTFVGDARVLSFQLQVNPTYDADFGL